MSYTICLFTVGTKQKEQQLGQPDFFEKDEINAGETKSIPHLQEKRVTKDIPSYLN